MKIGPKITLFVIVPMAVIVIIAMLLAGKPERQIEVLPSATATQSAVAIKFTVTSSPTQLPTHTPGPTPTQFPTPPIEEGWIEVFAGQAWVRQISSLTDTWPCPTFWGGGLSCGGETIEVVVNLDGYYFNVWDATNKPIESIALTRGVVVTYEVPVGARIGFGNLAASP